MTDHIKVHNLSLIAPVSVSPWPSLDPPKTPIPQPVIVSLDILHDITAAGTSDDLTQSINYSEVSKLAQKACFEPQPSGDLAAITAFGLADRILEQCLAGISLPISEFAVEIELPKAVLRAKGASVHMRRRRDFSLVGKIKFVVKDLLVHTIVGINPQEREDKQPIILNIELFCSGILSRDFHFPFAKLERSLSTAAEGSSFLTIEALAHDIARHSLMYLDDGHLYEVSVSVAKPAALRLADAPEIVITRSLSDFPSEGPRSNSASSSKGHIATLALGSNLGDKFQDIEVALRYLEHLPWISGDLNADALTIIDTSFMYETKPMYVTSQPSFLNCACLIETTLTPIDLLRICKIVEGKIGREPGIRFGPRVVDVDIVTYDSEVLDTRRETERDNLDNLEGQLVIPHPRMAEREFVLRPLTDIMPEWVHPQLRLPVRSLLSKLVLFKPVGEPPMLKAVPFPRSKADPENHPKLDIPSTLTYWLMPESRSSGAGPSQQKNGRTRIMATLNFTPDSFSDGGKNNTTSAALDYASDAVRAGADIIDVGGYSTRPGAAFVSEEDEADRVIKAIQSIRASQDERVKSIPISVDTFRPSVAEAAIAAGANCINDVYALHGPDYPLNDGSNSYFNSMRDVARRHCVPVIMMHSRGDAGSNKDYTTYGGSSELPVLEGVRSELAAKVLRATRGPGALRRWQVVIDPGIGFSKTVEGNLELLRNAAALSADKAVRCDIKTEMAEISQGRYKTPGWNPLAGFPMLIGTSRKSFLGEIIARPRLSDAFTDTEESQKRPANERDFATAAAVACAVQQGAAVVRVHEVKGMVDVVKVAEALW